MRYFANPSTPRVRDAMATGLVDIIATPTSTRDSQWVQGVTWCADNGAFSDRWDQDTWWAWLQAKADRADTCAFAVAPDVVGDAAATLDRSLPWMPRIRALGYPVAFVAQDGLEDLPVPWDEFDVLFIGGTTTWKLGPHPRRLAAEAKARGKRVHMGRVNSYRRLRYAEAIGCDSADGTFLTFGPDTNLPRMRAWLHRIHADSPLFTITSTGEPELEEGQPVLT